MLKSKRICSGCYEVTAGKRTMEIYRIPPNKDYGDPHDMWIVTNHGTYYSDPVETKREAMQIAASILKDLIR
jgi:hypothetical protein